MKNFLSNHSVKLISAGLFITFIVLTHTIKNKDSQALSIKNSQLWENSLKEMTLLCDNQPIYTVTIEIKDFTQDNFLEYSIVNYPRIEFLNEKENRKTSKKINQLFYETSMLHYDEELEEELNAFYSCNFFITFANEDYICIYYMESISAGMSSVTDRKSVV